MIDAKTYPQDKGMVYPNGGLMCVLMYYTDPVTGNLVPWQGTVSNPSTGMVTDSTLQGDGSPGNPLKIAIPLILNGAVQLNGSLWTYVRVNPGTDVQIHSDSGEISLTPGSGYACNIHGDFGVAGVSTLNGQVNLNGGQINFPATQNVSASPNTLDDYRENVSWTPGIGAASGSGVTYSGQIGTLTKIGNLIFMTYYIALTSKGTLSGTLYLTGFPYMSIKNAGFCMLEYGNLATAIADAFMVWDGTNLDWYVRDTATGVTRQSRFLSGTDLTNTTVFQGHMVLALNS